MLHLCGFAVVYSHTHWEGCVFVTVCALPWSVPHVFDITVTRLPSLSGEMENVRDLSGEANSFPTSGWNEKHTGWMAGLHVHSVGAEQRVEAK